MTPRDMSRFANLSLTEKTSLLESALPKEQILKEDDSGFVENQRKGLDVFLTDVDKSIAEAEKRLKKLRKKVVEVDDYDIVFEGSDDVIYEESDEDDAILLDRPSTPIDTPTGGWKW